MPTPDLNLLVTLDVLLAEGSVTRAGRRLALSPSAMSRTLSRLRAALGDPLLVRAGRGLVPTPRALALRERVRPLVEEIEAVLRPAAALDLAGLERTFTLRTRDGFVETFGPALLARLREAAPRVRLRFEQKIERDSTPLRDGAVDLETGVVERTSGPELRSQALFRDRFVGVVRAEHPWPRGRVSLARYSGAQHIAFSRRERGTTPVDAALALVGEERDIVASVDGFASALALARATDLVATVPERHTGLLRSGMRTFTLPVETPAFTVAMLWHPRQDADPAHRWLRDAVRAVCATSQGPNPRRSR